MQYQAGNTVLIANFNSFFCIAFHNMQAFLYETWRQHTLMEKRLGPPFI